MKNYLVYFILILFFLKTDQCTSQETISNDEIRENLMQFFQPKVYKDFFGDTITEEYEVEFELICSANKVYYVIDDRNKDRSKLLIRLYALHDINAEDNYINGLTKDLGMAYLVPNTYITELENTVLPCISKEFPNAETIIFRHLTKGKKLESFININEPNEYKKYYDSPLTITLERIYPKGIVERYVGGNGYWQQSTNYNTASVIQKNSKNFAEAQLKYEEAVKIGEKIDSREQLFKYIKRKKAIDEDEKEVVKEKLRKFFIQDKYKPFKDSFWDNLDGDYYTIKSFYNGDFNNLSIDGSPTEEFLYRYYVNYVSESCRSRLPSKTVNFSETIKIEGGSEYSHTLYMGNMSFANVYNHKEDQIINISVDMAPKFEKKYLEINDKIEFSFKKIGFHDIKAFKDFFEKNDCDSKVYNLLGENLYRFFHNKPSLQMEAGVYKN